MQFNINTLSVFFVIVMLGGCANSTEHHSKVITVSILPFSYFTKKIAGDAYDVNVIVPLGASPASFEPPPSVIKKLKQSDGIILDRYLGFEQAWMDKLLEVNPSINTIYLADNQDLIAIEAKKHGSHFHLSGVDPHFWVSPSSAMVIAKDIFEFLSLIYPNDSTIFRENCEKLLFEIRKIDEYAKESFSKPLSKRFIIFHPSLGYLSRDYGLEQVALEREGKEPSVAWMKKIIDIAKKDSINTILVQEEFSKSSAKTFSLEINGNVSEINPLSENWPKAMVDIIDALSNNNTF